MRRGAWLIGAIIALTAIGYGLSHRERIKAERLAQISAPPFAEAENLQPITFTEQVEAAEAENLQPITFTEQVEAESFTLPAPEPSLMAAVESLVEEEPAAQPACDSLPSKPEWRLCGFCLPNCCTICGTWGPDLYLGGRADNWRRGAGAEGFVPISQNGCSLLFIQGGTGWFRDLYTGNIGAGYRWLTGHNNTALGINVFYDASGRSGKIYSQIGGGLEILGCWWLARANYYQPIELRTKRLVNVTQAGLQLFERQAYRGFDAEIGKGILFYAGELWGFAGYFYYRAHQVDPLHGPRIRGEYRLQSLPFCINGELILGAEVEYDRLHKTTGSATLELRLFLDRCRPRECCRSPICRLMGRRVERERMIRVETTPLEFVVPGPADGIIFFNNTIDGIGTQLNPALLPNAIAMAAPGDILFGLQDTGNVPVDWPIPLLPEQHLLGFSGPTRVVELPSGMTIVVTDLTGSGQVVLDIATDGVVTMTDNFICGVTLQGGDRGIVVGAWSGDVEVENVNFRNLPIAVDSNLGGALTVSNSTFFDGATINAIGMTDDLLITGNTWPVGSSGSIRITDPATLTTATISENAMVESSIFFNSITGGTLNIDRNTMEFVNIQSTILVPRVNITSNINQFPVSTGDLFAIGDMDLRILNNMFGEIHVLAQQDGVTPAPIVCSGNTFASTTDTHLDLLMVAGSFEVTNNLFSGGSGPASVSMVFGGPLPILGLVDDNQFVTGNLRQVMAHGFSNPFELTVSNNQFGNNATPISIITQDPNPLVSCITITGNSFDPLTIPPVVINLDTQMAATLSANPHPFDLGPTGMGAANNGMTIVLTGTAAVAAGPPCLLPIIPP
ncbi:MAG: inverse autotransporter beta domain-containing protein [Parachlamydiales bacterium]